MGNLTFQKLPLSGAYTISLSPFSDNRGWFSRVYCEKEFGEIDDVKWVQINHSFTAGKGTIRGMHFQYPPHSEVKLVRCISGSIFDVIVDLRKNSSTFLHWFGVELSAQNRKMIYIPEGFAHGFQSLKDNSELIYHHTEYYNPKYEAGIKFDEPVLDIKWPLPLSFVSERDQNHEYLDKSFKGLNYKLEHEL